MVISIVFNSPDDILFPVNPSNDSIILNRTLDLSSLICTEFKNVSCFSDHGYKDDCQQCINGSFSLTITWFEMNRPNRYDFYELRYGEVDFFNKKLIFTKWQYKWISIVRCCIFVSD